MQSYSAALCANFEDLKETNRSTHDSFTTLLFGYLCFRAQTTGGIITTTHEALEQFFNCSKAILRKMIKILTKIGVITPIITSNSKGYKRTTIKVSCTEKSFFDYNKICILRKHTNDDELSLLYSFIAYKLTAYGKLEHHSWLEVIDGQVWWQLDIKRIAEQFSISERTAFRRINKIRALELLDKKVIGKKTYYTINQKKYEKISTDYEEYLFNKKSKCDFVSDFTDRQALSSINNTSTDDHKDINNNNTIDSDVNLNNLDDIGKDLNKRQSAYLLAAIKKTLKKVNGNAELIFSWIKFSILNPCQRQGVTKFKHAVNRFMQLLRERKLMEPFGYKKHTEEGRQYWAGVLERQNAYKYDDNDVTPATLAEQVVENCTDDDYENRRDLGEMGNNETGAEMMQKPDVERQNAERPSEKKQRLLNEKAVRFCDAIVEKSKDEKANAAILEHLWLGLDECIKQGADFGRIDEIVGHLAI